MADTTDDRSFIYRIDADNRIIFVNREWIEFAGENEAVELIPKNVLGRIVDRFIDGWETRHLYEIIYRSVRRSGREIRFLFRCDSPTQRRFFSMRIALLEKERLEFTAQVVRIEPHPSLPLLDYSLPRSSTFIVICSWCRRILIDAGRWVEIEDAVDKHELFGPAPPSLSHGVCPDCFLAIRGQIHEE